ncbi:hypothetical protein BDY24DRAFT_440560 [Mrakia frigida]|uniref:uncharacterized protein n=1 Tax=Mrakia frigida TaxID=29902 RepID=UPI003FCBFEE8
MTLLRSNPLPPPLLLLLLSLSLFSVLLLLVVPTPSGASSLEHLLPQALRPSGRHPHHYQPLHLFDPELNAWALKPFRKSSEFTAPGEEEEWENVEGGGRLGVWDLGMIGFVFVAVAAIIHS